MTDTNKKSRAERFVDGAETAVSMVTMATMFGIPLVILPVAGAILLGKAAVGALAASAGLGMKIMMGTLGAVGGAGGGLLAGGAFGAAMQAVFKKKDPSYGLIEALSVPVDYAGRATRFVLSPLLLLKAKPAFDKAAGKNEAVAEAKPEAPKNDGGATPKA